MPTITTEVEVDVDFDLSDYEDDIEHEYCNGNCLKNRDTSLYLDLKEYVDNMYKTLYLTIDNSRDIKNMEQIMNDLQRILEDWT